MWETDLGKVSNELISGQFKNRIQMAGLMIRYIMVSKPSVGPESPLE